MTICYMLGSINDHMRAHIHMHARRHTHLQHPSIDFSFFQKAITSVQMQLRANDSLRPGKGDKVAAVS